MIGVALGERVVHGFAPAHRRPRGEPQLDVGVEVLRVGVHVAGVEGPKCVLTDSGTLATARRGVASSSIVIVAVPQTTIAP